MGIKKTEKIWHNGKWINWEDARIHILSYAVTVGSMIFEGIRCYNTKQGPAIFRLREHMQRLFRSSKICRTDIPFTLEELCAVAATLPAVNDVKECYIKPMVIRGLGDGGLNPFKCPIDVFMACWEWGLYLGEDSHKAGVDACISTWTRIAPNTHPAMAKIGGNYINSQLIIMEAVTNGYTDGIALDHAGNVSEGSGMNVFLVSEGTVITPPLTASILPGITRRSVITLCKDLEIPCVEQNIPREMLYIADEVFFVGTATEIVPVRSIDRIPIGAGSEWPVTRRLQEEFAALTRGGKPDRHNWLTPVAGAATGSGQGIS
jgi:branched-chain amino acid aminotransferase